MQIENIFPKTKVANFTQQFIPCNEKTNDQEREDVITLNPDKIKDGNSLERAMPSENYTKLGIMPTTKKAPYGEFADDNGLITYNGVTFVCDYKRNLLCLGDVSNPDNCLTIPLKDGGCLRVNRNILDDLSKAIGMFSPEDVKRILDSIAADKKAKEKLMEKEENVSKATDNIIN